MLLQDGTTNAARRKILAWLRRGSVARGAEIDGGPDGRRRARSHGLRRRPPRNGPELPPGYALGYHIGQHPSVDHIPYARPAARRPVRHLPGRPVPAVGRLRRGPAARGSRLPGRGAARRRPAAASRRSTPAIAPTTERDCARGLIDAFARLRLCGGAVGLLRRDAAGCICRSCSTTSPAMQERAGELAGRCLRAGRASWSTSWACARSRPSSPATATYHDSCSGLRELGVKRQPRQLLAGVDGPGAGRAGRTARSAAASAARSASSIRRSRPGWSTNKAARDRGHRAPSSLLAGDLGCLMNMAGRLKRLGSPVQARHVAEVLAGDAHHAADRRAAEPVAGHGTDHARLQGPTPTRRSDDPVLQAALGRDQDRLGRQARRAPPSGCPSSRRCATRAATIKNHTPGPSRPLSRGVRGQGASSAAGRCIGRATPPRRARSCSSCARRAGARSVTKSKSMVTEEIGLNAFLEAHELDAGRDRSRRVHPADLRPAAEPHRGPGGPHDAGRDQRPVRAAPRRPRGSTRRPSCVAEARRILRQRYLAADVGITGANFLIAETGSAITVTNEGNAELTQGLPEHAHRGREPREGRARRWRTPSRSCACSPRSATGQEFSTYTTVMTGPEAARAIWTGPSHFHVVLLDNGRSADARATSCATCCAASAAAPA